MTKTERTKLRKDKPEVWVPVESGDRIEGRVTDIAAAWSDTQYKPEAGPDSGFYPLLRVQVTGTTPGYEAGQVLAVHCFAAVLQSRVLEKEPAPGELVIITYQGTGEKKVKGRNAPELFTLEVPGRDPQETARVVYGQLRGKRRGPANGQQAPVEPDIPLPDSEPAPF